MKYRRGPDLVKETVEFQRGDETNWCTGCYRDYPLSHFTTMMYKGQRRLISWCKECVKAKMRPQEKAEAVLVNRQGMLHVRKPKGMKKNELS